MKNEPRAGIGARAIKPAGGSAGRLQQTLHYSGRWRAARELTGHSPRLGHSRSPTGLSSAAPAAGSKNMDLGEDPESSPVFPDVRQGIKFIARGESNGDDDWPSQHL